MPTKKKNEERRAAQREAQRANIEKNIQQNRNKPKPAIKPNSTAVRSGSTNPTLAAEAALAQAPGKPISKDGMNFLNQNKIPNFQGLLGQLKDPNRVEAKPAMPPSGRTPEEDQFLGSMSRSMPGIAINTDKALAGFRARNQPQAPGTPLGQAQPASAAAAQALQSPMSPPPAKAIVPTPTAPVPPAAASPIAPQPSAPAPQVVSPVASMQAQKDQMFPPAPATPPAPMAPMAPKPAQITPPAGVTKSQAEIDEEKKKQMAATGV